MLAGCPQTLLLCTVYSLKPLMRPRLLQPSHYLGGSCEDVLWDSCSLSILQESEHSRACKSELQQLAHSLLLRL